MPHPENRRRTPKRIPSLLPLLCLLAAACAADPAWGPPTAGPGADGLTGEAAAGISVEVGLSLLASPPDGRHLPANLPKAFLPSLMNFWQHSSRDPAPARPATRLLVRWLQINGLEAHGCEDASFAFLNTGCDPEQIALVEAEHFSGSSEAAAELRSQAKCVVDLTQRGRVFSGVCSGDNGHRQPLPESYSGLVRVSMNGLKAGHKAACEAGLLCNGTLRQWRDVVVPGLQLRGRDEDSFSQEAQLPPEAARRGALLYFAGSTPTRREGPHTEGANLRETLRQRYAREPGFNFSRLEGAEYRRALANAEFCLAPLGMHGGWGSRWKHAVMMGCIPVMMDEGTLQPLEPLFPKDTYGVALSYADVDRLPAILRSISREERLRKRRALAAMRPYAMWTQNLPYALYRLLLARFGTAAHTNPLAEGTAKKESALSP